MSENRCITCGEAIPEGYQVCKRCESGSHGMSQRDILTNIIVSAKNKYPGALYADRAFCEYLAHEMLKCGVRV